MLPDAQEVLYDSGEEDDIQLVQNMVDFDNMYVHNLRERAEQAGCQNRRNRRQLSKEQEQDLSTNLERMALPRQPVRNVTDLQPAEEEDESQEGRRKKREDVRLAWATNEVHQEDMSFQGSTLNYRGCEFTFPFPLHLFYQHMQTELEAYQPFQQMHQYLREIMPAQNHACCSRFLLKSETEAEGDSDQEADPEFDTFFSAEDDDPTKPTLRQVGAQSVVHEKWRDGAFPVSEGLGKQLHAQNAYLRLYGINVYDEAQACEQLQALDDAFLIGRRKMLQLHFQCIQYSLFVKGLMNAYVLEDRETGVLYRAWEAMLLINDFIGMGYNLTHSLKSWQGFRMGKRADTNIISVEWHVKYSDYQFAFMALCELLIRWGNRLNADHMVCSELVNERNQPTFFWTEVSTIAGFIEQHVTLKENMQLWQLVKGRYQARLEKELELRNEQTPVIFVRRSAFSFENGVFDAYTMRFYCFDNVREVQELYNMPPVDEALADGDEYDVTHPANQPFTSTERMCTARFFTAKVYGQNAMFREGWQLHLQDVSPRLNAALAAQTVMARLGLVHEEKSAEYEQARANTLDFFNSYMLTSNQFRKQLQQRMTQYTSGRSPYHKWFSMLTSFHRWAHHYKLDVEGKPVRCNMGELCPVNKQVTERDPVQVSTVKTTMDFYKYSTVDVDGVMSRELWGCMPASFLEIHTPNIDKVFADQDLPPGVLVMWFVFVGRLLYDINKLDQWQMTTYFEGIAGTGKSSLMVLIDHIFDQKYVGSLTSSARNDFWGSNLLGKFIAMVGDVGETWTGAQAVLQQMISGERTMVEPKNKTPLNLKKWVCHIIMSGNVFPSFTDTSGAIPRRFLVFHFNNIITEKLSGFERALEQEVPAMLVKAAIMYKWAIVYFGKSKLDSHPLLPSYFKHSMKTVKMKINPLYDFVTESKMTGMLHLACLSYRKPKLLSNNKNLYLFQSALDTEQLKNILPCQNLEVWNLNGFLVQAGIVPFLVRAYIELTHDISADSDETEFHDAHAAIPSVFQLPPVPHELLDMCSIHDDCALKLRGYSWSRPSLAELRKPNGLIELWKHSAEVLFDEPRDALHFKSEFFNTLNLAFQFMRGHTCACPLPIKQRVFFYLFNAFCTPLDTFNTNYSVWATRKRITMKDKAAMLSRNDTSAMELFQRLKLQFTTLENLGYKLKNELHVVLGMSMCNFKALAGGGGGRASVSNPPTDGAAGSGPAPAQALKPMLLSDLLGPHPLGHVRFSSQMHSGEFKLQLPFPPAVGVRNEDIPNNCKILKQNPRKRARVN